MQYITDLKGINGVSFCYDDENLREKFLACRRALEDSDGYELNADTVLLDSFHSATIEGARTTIESVKKSVLAPKSKSDRMVVNTMKALDMVYSGFAVHDGSIRELWEQIVDGVCENTGVMGEKYRDGEVYISSADWIVHVPASHTEIDSCMHSLFAFMDKADLDGIYIGIIAHFYFVYIHPFCDGNGRAARILQNYCLYGKGYSGVRKIRISQAINMRLGAYYKALEHVETPVVLGKRLALDLTEFIAYMLDRILEACRLSEKKQYDLSGQEKRLLERMSKRGMGAEITVSNAASILGVGPDRARTVLNGLADKNYLFKTKAEGKNKNIYRLLVLIS